MILGALIALFGILVLLRNLGVVSFSVSLWAIFYPLLFVVIGVYVFLAGLKARKYWWLVKGFTHRFGRFRSHDGAHEEQNGG